MPTENAPLLAKNSTTWLLALAIASGTLCIVAVTKTTENFAQATQITRTSQLTRATTALNTVAKDSGMNRVKAYTVPVTEPVEAQTNNSTWMAATTLLPLLGFAAAFAVKMLGRKDSELSILPLIGEKEMKVWNPINNKKFETFSYLPPLNDNQIARQVDMIIAKGLSPCLEFAAPDSSFTSNENTIRFSGSAAGYYDNRYWTMWKLPMFGCSDPSQVLREIAECRRAYPQCYVRLAAFDKVKQVQVISFLVQRPSGSGGGYSPAPVPSYSPAPAPARPSSGYSWAMLATSGEKEMKVWNPIDNKKFETFSYLPPLNDNQIARQVDMIIAKGLSPCLEFAAPDSSFTSNENTIRFSGSAAGYYDNRYWTMWKLPMFGCSDPSQVLREIAECRRAYPQCYVRLAAFDKVKQVQVISFLVQRPSGSGAGYSPAPARGSSGYSW